MDVEATITLTADIVAAHVSNNSVAVGDLPALIQNVHNALSGLGQTPTEEAVPQTREPAVSIRSSVKPEAITCLVCGSKNKVLKRHISTAHGMTPQEYRGAFGLKADHPMVAPNYAEQRRTLAKSIGLGTKGNRKGSTKGAPKSKGHRAAPAR